MENIFEHLRAPVQSYKRCTGRLWHVRCSHPEMYLGPNSLIIHMKTGRLVQSHRICMENIFEHSI